MTVAEIKTAIEQSTPEERLYLAAFLRQLGRNDDPGYRAELSRLNAEIDDGKKFSLSQVKRLHEALEAERL